jgi:hypothetical protein
MNGTLKINFYATFLYFFQFSQKILLAKEMTKNRLRINNIVNLILTTFIIKKEKKN